MNSTNSFPRLLGRILFSGSLIALIATTIPTADAKQPSEPSTTARLSATQVLNPKDFGATGDGLTDDGPALQAALDMLGNNGGGTLYIPPGEYAIFSPVTKDFTGVASSITGRAPDPGGFDTGEGRSRSVELINCALRQDASEYRQLSFVESEFQENGRLYLSVETFNYGDAAQLLRVHAESRIPKIISRLARWQRCHCRAVGHDARVSNRAFPLTMASSEFIDAVLSRVRQTTGDNLDSERLALLEDYEANDDRAPNPQVNRR